MSTVYEQELDIIIADTVRNIIKKKFRFQAKSHNLYV